MKTPKRKEIIPPKGGWEEKAYYMVEVAYTQFNVIHRGILYAQFLNGPKGSPRGLNEIWSPLYEGKHYVSEIYYMKAISKLAIDLHGVV